MNSVPAAATLAEISRCRRALQEAVLQDFLDDFPDPTHPADVARRLYLSHSLVRYHVIRGDIAATFRDGRWHIDVQASRDWITRSLAGRSGRRLRTRGMAKESSAITVSISELGALNRLRDLQATGLTPRDVVEHALRSLGASGDDTRLLGSDPRAALT